MNIWEIDKLVLFLIFLIPGFISIKVYDLMVPGEQKDFAGRLLEAIGYSAINFAILSWLIIIIHSSNFYFEHTFWYSVILVFILFIFPTMLPIVYKQLISWKPLSKYIIHPLPKPWDYVFGKGEAYWVIVHLKDGRMIGGVYDENSFASSYPVEEQIYLEEVWKLSKDGIFLEQIKRSSGIIIMRDEILSVELFK